MTTFCRWIDGANPMIEVGVPKNTTSLSNSSIMFLTITAINGY